MKDDNLWKVFSEYIRRKHADENGFVTCITSGRRMHWTECDAGHFISRRHLATKFDERNVWPQSRHDNRFAAGKQYEFALAIDKKLGKGTADKLLIASRQVCKRSKFEIDVMTKHYQNEVKQLKKEKYL